MNKVLTITPESLVKDMTLRAFFAAEAMKGYCARDSISVNSFESQRMIAEMSVTQSDYLIEFLNKTPVKESPVKESPKKRGIAEI